MSQFHYATKWKIILKEKNITISDGHSSLANAQLWLRDCYLASHGKSLGATFNDYTFDWYRETVVR